MSRRDVHAAARGRWRSILSTLGVDSKYLTGKHGPCPFCGGKDRFRFTDHEAGGGFICNQCGGGNGVDLVMKFKNLDFIEAVVEIEKIAGSAPVQIGKPTTTAEQLTKIVKSKWAHSFPLDGYCPASKYLTKRGVAIDPWPNQLRYDPEAKYVHADKTVTIHPALLAQFASPDASALTLQITYLTYDGDKADVESPRKMAKGPLPAGGAVRLSPSADTMGIAEGTETAIAAMILHGVPVWAALSAGGLMKWKPPATAKNVIIYGDSDVSATGQVAAWTLCYRLRQEGYHVDVMMPPEQGTDWLDVLASERRLTS